MSLCPNYCDCPRCKHGYQTCVWCSECHDAYLRARKQREHEASVKRQQSKIKRMVVNNEV